MDPPTAQIQYVQTPAEVVHSRNLQIPDAFLRSLVQAKSVEEDAQFKYLAAKVSFHKSSFALLKLPSSFWRCLSVYVFI